MMDHAQFAQKLSTWYMDQARAFLSEVAGDRTPQLDQELVRLDALRKLVREDLPICFLGTAGVGKSTLINAVVAGRDVVLPAGGVGPLTAEATSVRYASERRFRVEYHAPTKLNKLLFVIERAHEKELARSGRAVESQIDELAAGLSEEDRREAEFALIEEGEAADAAQLPAPDLASALTRQATLLIRGNQFAVLDRGYVLDRLRDCLGAARRWGTEPTPDDAKRVTKLKQVLVRARGQSTPFEVSAKRSEAGFRGELEQHAAGHLAPLVRTLEVGWDTELWRSGVVLVDLPGVGVANDEFRRVTAHWIRQARGVILVVDRAGMTEAGAELLRTSGFLNSLLHESDDPEDLNATLIVAVVKLDATADDARVKEKLLSPDGVRPWAVHFDEACERAKVMVREQLAIELQKVSELGGESTRDERAAVIRRVLEGMQVHPVVAPQYRKLLAEDEDDPPRIKTAEQSRIPGFSRALQGLISERSARVDARIEFLVRNVLDRLRSVLELTQARAEQEGTERHQ